MENKYLQEFQASSIASEIIELNFREVQGDTVYEYLAIGCQKRLNNGRLPKAWLDLYRHCEQGGWWCSGIDLVKGNDNDWGCFKPDFPRMDEYGLKPIKYEHPKGVMTDVFALRIGKETASKISQRYNIPIDEPNSFWDVVKANVNLPVILTEGAKKAAALLSAGFIAIALPGIWGAYRRELKDSHGLIPPIVTLAQSGRLFVFAYDQDGKSETRKQVKAAIKKTSACLEAFECSTVTLNWPEEWKGVDDLITGKGVDYFEGLFNKMLHPAEVSVSGELVRPEQWGELKEWEGENLHDSFQEQARKDLYGEGHWAAIDRDLYKFNGRFYEKVSSAAEEKRIIAWANSNPVWDARVKRWVKSHLQTDHINKIWDWTLKYFRVDGEKVNPPGLNLKNGRLLLKWQGNRVRCNLHKHSAGTIYTYCSEVEYKPDADPSNCEKLLAALDPAQQVIFLRSLALALDLEKFRGLPKIGRVRACLLEGTGSNGKDALRTAVSQIFVRGMVSTTFNDFANYEKGSKGTLLKLEGACLSWSPENSTVPKIETLDSLKAAITGDPISVKALYVDEKEITPQTVFFFNINGVPRMDGALTAIITRWAILRFTKTFSINPNPAAGEIQGDPRFKDSPRWVAENVCPALLNQILEQVPKLIEEGIPYHLLDDSFREVREESCHLWEFVKAARIVEDKDGEIGVSELWAALDSWYEQNGTKEVVTDERGKTKVYWHDQSNKFDRNVTSKNQVFKAFQRLFPKVSRKMMTRGDENKGRLFISGINFLPDFNPFASLLSPVSFSASLSASLCLTENKKANDQEITDDENSVRLNPLPSKEVRQNGQKMPEKTFSPAHTETENFAKNGKKRDWLDPLDDAKLREMVNWEKQALDWTSEQLRDYCLEEFGAAGWANLTEADKTNLVHKLRAIYSELPN